MSQASLRPRLDGCVEMRRQREQSGLSRNQVARRLRWSTERVAELERGSAIPSSFDLTALARLYEEHCRLRARRRRREPAPDARLVHDSGEATFGVKAWRG